MAGSRTVFDAFVAANAESLLRTAHLLTMDAGEAEDLVQECLVLLVQRWHRVGAMDQPAAYARRVLVNLAVRGSSKRSRLRAELETDGVDRAADSQAVELTEDRDELWVALRRLTTRQRAVLVLRYFNDFSEAQTAQILGCSPGTVSSTTSRSLARLRELMGPTVRERSDQR